jgi:hypothetical protein
MPDDVPFDVKKDAYKKLLIYNKNTAFTEQNNILEKLKKFL